MIKILDGFSWLEDEIGDNTKEINECLEKGLMKYFVDDSMAKFIVLDSNINKVKEILKDDYNKLEEWDIVKTMENFFGDYDDLTIENSFGDTINVSISNIIGLIHDDDEAYFPDNEKLEVYNSMKPLDAIHEKINRLGIFQVEMQIRDLLNSIGSQKFDL